MAVGQIISRAIADGAITTSNINDGEITHAKLHTDMDLSAKTLTVPATVRGPATLTIDPAAVGDNTGLVVIAGSLQVDGTTTTINSTTMTVDDKNIVLASGAANSAAADGAGITIDGANATILYTDATTSFDFNKPVNITGTLGVSGATTLSSTVKSVGNFDVNTNKFTVNASTGNTAIAGSLTVTGTTTFNENVALTGTKKIQLNSGDMDMYHYGGNNWFNSNTGDVSFQIKELDHSFFVKASSITSSSSPASMVVYIKAEGSTGEAQLYHYGSKKLATKTTGIEVTGTVIDDGAAHDGDVTFIGASYNMVWDKSDNALEFADDAELRFGDNDDFIIRHTGSHSQIRDVGTGKLKLSGSEIEINNENNTENMITAVANGQVKLYHNNSERLVTQSTGVDIKTSTGAILKLQTSDTSIFDGNTLGAIEFSAPNEASGTDAITTAASIVAEADTTFSSTTNRTDLVFKLGEIGTANEKLRLHHEGDMTLTNTVNNSDHGPILTLFKNPPSGTMDGYNLGTIDFAGTNTASPNPHLYARIYVEADDGTSNVEDGSIRFRIGSNGTEANNRADTMILKHEAVSIYGDVGIGTNNPSAKLGLNRVGDGDIIKLLKDATEAGSIGIESSGFYIDGEGSHAGLKFFLGSVAPRQNGADIDATIDLGWTGGKFKDIFASGTVYATPGGNDGSSANYAAKSANEILNNYGYKPSGLYWIREPNTGTPKQIYCDMETDGGGWMLWLEYNTSTNSMHNQATARGNLARSYNNNYSKYEVMVDASYVNQINRRSIRGVWELDANGGIRTNGFRNWGEVRLPETVGDQFQPDLDTYFNSSNSEWIGRTEYYGIAGASGWSSIGTGSQYVYIREPNPAVKPGTMRSYGGINYVWDYDGTQYGWWVHESSYAVPMFNTVTQNGGFEVGYAGGRRDVMEPNNTTGQNSYVNVQNSNNGPAILGVGSGVLVGEFSIMFNLGYSWGWSEMYIQDAIRTDNNMKNGGSPGAVLGDSFQYANNSSNNQGYYVYKTNDGVTQATAGNLTPYSFGNYYTMTRRRDGNLYVRDPGANIYNPGKFFGPMKFFTGAQSPHATQILNVISAGRNSVLAASNEQAQTTLRH